MVGFHPPLSVRGSSTRVNTEQSVPKFENYLLSSLNNQMILSVTPGSFQDDALHQTSVSVYI